MSNTDVTRSAGALNKARILVTGGASGLGSGAVRQLLKRGAQVCIADINSATGQAMVSALSREFPQAEVSFLPLDLSDPGSIQRLANRLADSGDALDGLVNNAGIYPPAQRRLSPNGRELCFDIAFTGHFALTLRLLPLLERADAPKVVTVTSLTQQFAGLDFNNLTLEGRYTPIAAYAQAKLSNLLFALEFQRRLGRAGYRTRSYAAHPGVVRTALGANRPRDASDSAWQSFRYWFLSKGLASFGQSPENGARSIVMPFIDPAVQPGAFLGPGRLFKGFGQPVLTQPAPLALNAEVAARLWSLGETWTGLRMQASVTETSTL